MEPLPSQLNAQSDLFDRRSPYARVIAPPRSGWPSEIKLVPKGAEGSTKCPRQLMALN